MTLKFFSGKFLRIISFPLILLSLLMDVNYRNNEVLANKKLIPADNNDLFLYKGMGATYFCLAAKQGVDFNTAIGVAAATYAQVLEGKHGGLVKELGDTKLDRKQLFAGARDQIIITSINICPDDIPEDISKQVNDLLERNKDNKESKNNRKSKNSKKSKKNK